MSTPSNSGFDFLSSMMSRQGNNTSSQMIPMGLPYSRTNLTNAAAPGSSSNPLELLSGDHNTDTSEWSRDELNILKHGLEMYKDVEDFRKVFYIGATLPNKNIGQIFTMVEENSSLTTVSPHQIGFNPFSVPSTIAGDLSVPAKNIFEQNVQQTRASLSSHMDKSSLASLSPHHLAFYPFSVPSTIAGDLSGPAINLLEQNVQAFRQMKANLSSHKAEDNLDLLRKAWNNLITIQNDVNFNMPGPLNKPMVPLPVALKDLSVLPSNTKQSGGFNIRDRSF